MRNGIQIVVLTLALVAAMTPIVAGQEGEREGCFTSFGHCMERAAAIDSFFYRTAAGLDCELDLIECAREKVFGA